MHLKDEIQVEALNRLLAVNNNRAECLAYAQKQAGAKVLKSLFVKMHDTGEVCREALSDEIFKLGGKPFEGTLATADFLRIWKELESAFSGNDHFSILSAVCHQEGAVLRSYAKEINEGAETLNSIQLRILSEQFTALKTEAGKVSNLRETLVSALVRETVKAEMAKLAAARAQQREIPAIAGFALRQLSLSRQ